MNETRISKKDKNQHIQVFVRVRPANNAEKLGKSITVIDVPSCKDIIVRERPQDKHSKKFTFDKVFGPTSKQVNVYQAVVSPLLEEVLAGYNCTVFAYGQTGTGKTFTMEGVSNDPSLHWESDTSAGIIPRSLSHLFDELRTLDAQEYSVRVSFLELYNEELFDLLSPSDDASKIRLYEDASKKGAVIIHGLEEVTVHNKSEVYKILEKGSEKRQTAATLMNAHSSRSHTVFSITVHIKENTVDGEELLKTGKLNLVDLAGSENVGRSGAVDRRAREAGNINQSLLTLGRVITALVERAPHIPYRESKLTRLLQESLGGRTKTSIIATISPASINLEETLSTLDYAHRAKNITNRPELNQKLSKKALLKEYTEEIERLRRDLLATRERNGVYLAHENYNEMQAQIDCQEKDIADKINHIKALQEEMNKKDDIFNELKTNFELHLNDLNETKGILSSTQDSLRVTETRLMQTQQERDEHKHLVEKHVATERILSSQARKLLGVADVATNDTYKLHDKICRKTQVEQENETLGQQFQRDMTNRVEEIEKDCTEYTQNLVQFCMSMKDDIAAQIAAQSRGIDTTIEYISTDLVQKQSVATKNLAENGECSFNRYQAWTKEQLQNVQMMSDDENKRLNEMSATLAPNIERLINSQVEQNLQIFRKDMVEKLESMFSYVENSVDDVCNKLTMGKDRISKNVTKVKEQLAVIQTKKNDILRDNESFDKAFEKLCKHFVAMKKSNEERLTDIANIITEVDKTQDDVLTDVTELCDNGTETQRCHEDKMKEQITTIKNDVRNSIDENISILNTVAAQGRELIKEMETKIQDRSNAWIKHRDTVKQNVVDLQGAAQHDKQQILSSAQELQSIVADASVNHEEFMESQRCKMRRANLELQQKLEEQGVGATQWGAEVTAQLRTTHHQVEKFLAEDLRRDIPTGGTPVRKEHQYPRELAATSPHDRIIQRFRAAMHEAVAADNENDNKENAENDIENSGDILQKQMISKLKAPYLGDRRVLGSYN